MSTPNAALAAVTVISVLLCTAAPAAADPARPTDYRSEVTRIDPPAPGVAIEVIGGDGFLRLEVTRGVDVVVEGYSGEPWLHIDADGTVAQNRRSPATYLNEDRYARTGPPPDHVDAEAPPEWVRIGSGGTHIWHDHRIHWMSPDPPPGRAPGDVIFDDWTVALRVDGEPVTVHGRLRWEPDESVLPWIALGVAVFAAVALVGWTRTRAGATVLAAGAIGVAGALAVIAGIGELDATPGAAGGTPLVVVAPAAALAVALAGVVLRRRPHGAVLVLGAGLFLGGWALLRADVLTHPVLPTSLPADLDRFATASAAGASVAVLVVGARAAGFFGPRVSGRRAPADPAG